MVFVGVEVIGVTSLTSSPLDQGGLPGPCHGRHAAPTNLYDIWVDL